jgi:hypothetical protein
LLRLRTCFIVALVVAVAACQERLASPADCPNLCPGSFDVRDTILYPLSETEATFTGYLRAGQGSSLRVSYQLPVSEDRALFRFGPRPDSFIINGAGRTYTVDSVGLELSLLFRDSMVPGLKLYLYRLPAAVDSLTTFAEVDGAFVPSAIIDSFLVDDSVLTRRFTTILKGPDLAKIAIPPADSGVLAFGVQVRASAPTGVRIGSASSGASTPTFRSYVTVPDTINDTTLARTLTPSVRFNTFVSQAPLPVDQSVLTLGGAPSSRAIVRFPWPALLKDSAQLIRATLELVPVVPFDGLPNDSAFVIARPVLADLGGKSSTASDVQFAGVGGFLPGDTTTLGLEVRRAVLSWQGDSPLPPMFMLMMFPEASTFSVARLGSSQSPQALQPRLRVTYTLTYPFGKP